MKTTESKTYSSASNAKRAAKAAGIKPENMEVYPVEISGSHGPEVQYSFRDKSAKPAAKKADRTTKGKEADITDAKAAAAHKPAKKAAAKTVQRSDGAGLTKEQKAELRKLEEQALENGELSGRSQKNGGTGFDGDLILIVRKSVIKNPVQESWELFDNLRTKADKSGDKLRRKDAIAIAVQSGIAFYTARTQYQSWKTANKF